MFKAMTKVLRSIAIPFITYNYRISKSYLLEHYLIFAKVINIWDIRYYLGVGFDIIYKDKDKDSYICLTTKTSFNYPSISINSKAFVHLLNNLSICTNKDIKKLL